VRLATLEVSNDDPLVTAGDRLVYRLDALTVTRPTVCQGNEGKYNVFV